MQRILQSSFSHDVRKLFVLYLLVGAFSIPAGALYVCLISLGLPEWEAGLAALPLGLALAHVGTRWRERRQRVLESQAEQLLTQAKSTDILIPEVALLQRENALLVREWLIPHADIRYATSCADAEVTNLYIQGATDLPVVQQHLERARMRFSVPARQAVSPIGERPILTYNDVDLDVRRVAANRNELALAA